MFTEMAKTELSTENNKEPEVFSLEQIVPRSQNVMCCRMIIFILPLLLIPGVYLLLGLDLIILAVSPYHTFSSTLELNS